VPVFAIVVQQIAIRVPGGLNHLMPLSSFDIGPEGAKGVLGAMISLSLSFLVFTFGSLLVAIQVASGQMTPRIIATTLLRDNVVRYSVGLFVLTVLFAAGTLARTETKVDQLNLAATTVLSLVSLGAFLYLIDHAARLLRPVSIVARVSEYAIEVIDSVYPKTHRAPVAWQPLGAPARDVRHVGRSAIVCEVNLETLVAEAQRLDGVIEFVPQVGDFVAVGETLYHLYGGAAATDERILREAAVLGPERTLEQDATFAFRILVDIATKALSKAINDPTTAVLVIDQLHRLLRLVSKRDLGNETMADATGKLRVIIRTPNWDDYVHLAFVEIRHCGAESMQVVRRLRAMGENLLTVLPEHRHLPLRRQLDLLDRTVEKIYPFPEDLALARTGDSQGLGGASVAKR
jgi:uncharacterized membrane protein